VGTGPAPFAAIGLAGAYAPLAVAFTALGRAGRVAGAIAVAAVVVWALAAVRF
jgi:hypothetical protein